MKFYLDKMFLMLLFSIGVCSLSFSQKIQWEKSFGGKYADYLMDAQATADYGFILAGSSLSTKSGNKSNGNQGDLDYWIWKMNEKGDPEWQKNIGGTGFDMLQSLALTIDGGFIVAGTSSSKKGGDKLEDNRGNSDYWIVKLNAMGTEEWQKTIGGSGQEVLQSIHQTRDGGYIIGGSSSSELSGDKSQPKFGNMDYWLVKLDTKGKIEWQKVFGGTYVDELRSVYLTADGGYFIGGYSNSPLSGNKSQDNIGVGDYWVLKLDSKGEIQWQKTIGGDRDDQLYSVRQTYDNGYLIGGNSNSNNSYQKSKGNDDGTDFWVVKLNDKGESVWQETYNIAKTDILSSIVENEDHSFLLAGYAQAEANTSAKKGISNKSSIKDGTADYVAIRITEKGEEVWRSVLGSHGEDFLKKAIETRDGGYLLAGTSNAFGSSSTSSVSSSKKTISGIKGKENGQLAKGKKELNDAGTEQANDVNKKVANSIVAATDSTKKALGLNENSPLQLNSPTASIGGGLLNGNSAAASETNQKKLPPSRDKSSSYGSSDFWVVKLKDESKTDKPKVGIEALPNPTTQFTNVIVGYEYDQGTATVVDLSGHILKQFAITGRTIPVDLSAYPEGIYIVNIKTNIQSDGVKIIKGISKN
jgi:hypothetical protein